MLPCGDTSEDFLHLIALVVVSPVTSLMKDQVESFWNSEARSVKGTKKGPSQCKLTLALALRGCSSYMHIFSPYECRTVR